MDIPRPSRAQRRNRRRLAAGIATAILLALITLGLSHLKPAAPRVERATVWIDTVHRGAMVREARGTGSLVPEEVRWIPAVTEGRVERIAVQPGTTVDAGDVLLELSNPELERAALESEWQLKAARAEYVDLKVRLESALLNQRAAAASVEADYHQARLKADVDTELAQEGLISELNLKLSKVKVEELGTRNLIEAKRVQISGASMDAQLAVQAAKLEQLRALHDFRVQQVESLKVRPGIPGVLQQLSIEVGQQVAPGTILAKVARPDKLKAVLRIPQAQARDIQLAQKASFTVVDRTVAGHVVRIDPAVHNDTVTVDLAFDEPLPTGARPDLSVDGTIQLERLENVLYVGRPVQGQADSNIQLFKLEPDGQGAERVPVKLGRASVSTIEVTDGLKAGDQVVLSDMSNWDGFERIRF